MSNTNKPNAVVLGGVYGGLKSMSGVLAK